MSLTRDVGELRVSGRRSGLIRAVQLRYIPDSDGSILVRAGGSGEQWPLNLLADPDCEFVMGDGNTVRCRAMRIEGWSFRLVPR